MANLEDPTYWNELTERFSEKFDCQDFPNATAGFMFLGSGRKLRVGIAAHDDGIVASRLPLPFFFARAYVRWSIISRVAVYASVISREYANQAQAELYLDDDIVRRIVVPWSLKVFDYLLPNCGYEDKRPTLYAKF